jgi:hypothetical protein
MTGLIIVSVIIGGIAYALTGLGFLFWLAAGVVFVCGLPFALIFSLIHGEVSYAQDRADYREMMSEIAAAELADEHEFNEDMRTNRLIRHSKGQTNIYNDNRQVYLQEFLHMRAVLPPIGVRMKKQTEDFNG